MVKCYACNKSFDSHSDFYRHAQEEHGGIEEAIFEIETIRTPRDKVQEILEQRPDSQAYVECCDDEGNAVITLKKLRGVADPRFYINVWDCHGTLRFGEEEELENIGWFSVPKRLLKKFSVEELEKLCFQVLEDRGGAINMSGVYYLDEEHIKNLEGEK